MAMGLCLLHASQARHISRRTHSLAVARCRTRTGYHCPRSITAASAGCSQMRCWTRQACSTRWQKGKARGEAQLARVSRRRWGLATAGRCCRACARVMRRAGSASSIAVRVWQRTLRVCRSQALSAVARHFGRELSWR